MMLNYLFYVLGSIFFWGTNSKETQTTLITLPQPELSVNHSYRLYDAERLFAYQQNRSQMLTFLKEKKELQTTTFPLHTEVLHRGLDDRNEVYYVLNYENSAEDKKETVILTPSESVCALRGGDAEQPFFASSITLAGEQDIYLNGAIKEEGRQRGVTIYVDPTDRCTNNYLFAQKIVTVEDRNTTLLATYPLSSTKELSLLQYDDNKRLLISSDTALLNGTNWLAFSSSVKLKDSVFLSTDYQLVLLVEHNEIDYLVEIGADHLKSYRIFTTLSTTISGLATAGNRYFFYGSEGGAPKIFITTTSLDQQLAYLFPTLPKGAIYDLAAQQEQISFLQRSHGTFYWALLPGYSLLNQTKGCLATDSNNHTLRFIAVNDEQLFDFAYNETYSDNDLNPFLDNETFFYQFTSKVISIDLLNSSQRVEATCSKNKKADKACRRDRFIERTFLCTCTNHCIIFWTGIFLMTLLIGVGSFLFFNPQKPFFCFKSKRSQEQKNKLEKKLRQMINPDQEHSLVTLSEELEDKRNLVELSEI